MRNAGVITLLLVGTILVPAYVTVKTLGFLAKLLTWAAQSVAEARADRKAARS